MSARRQAWQGPRRSFDWRAAASLGGIFVAAVALFALGYGCASLSWMGYALAGVAVLIGLVTFGIGVWQGWRTAKYEWEVKRFDASQSDEWRAGIRG